LEKLEKLSVMFGRETVWIRLDMAVWNEDEEEKGNVQGLFTTTLYLYRHEKASMSMDELPARRVETFKFRVRIAVYQVDDDRHPNVVLYQHSECLPAFSKVGSKVFHKHDDQRFQLDEGPPTIAPRGWREDFIEPKASTAALLALQLETGFSSFAG